VLNFPENLRTDVFDKLEMWKEKCEDKQTQQTHNELDTVENRQRVRCKGCIGGCIFPGSSSPAITI
jgi:hypothetical protein